MNTTNTTLTLPEGLCTFSRGALHFTRQPTQEEWEQIGRYVHAARGSSLRWMADWRREGRRQFGDAIVEEAERQLEFEFKDLRAAEVLDKIDGYELAPSDAHAFVAAKLCKDSYEADDWLEKARTEKLTPTELQKSIKAGEIVREASGSAATATAGSGVLTLEAIHMDILRWQSRVADDGFPENWEPHQLRKVKDLTAVMAEIHRRASTSLLQKGAA